MQFAPLFDALLVDEAGDIVPPGVVNSGCLSMKLTASFGASPLVAAGDGRRGDTGGRRVMAEIRQARRPIGARRGGEKQRGAGGKDIAMFHGSRKSWSLKRFQATRTPVRVQKTRREQRDLERLSIHFEAISALEGCSRDRESSQRPLPNPPALCGLWGTNSGASSRLRAATARTKSLRQTTSLLRLCQWPAKYPPPFL